MLVKLVAILTTYGTINFVRVNNHNSYHGVPISEPFEVDVPFHNPATLANSIADHTEGYLNATKSEVTRKLTEAEIKVVQDKQVMTYALCSFFKEEVNDDK